ncbi:hypothetical protein AB6A40_010891 [Gnathostoma spinigerum]|uniref:Uncharacterized protein n=1 Tax=Gnathostoma spinigerum TaxID=75299 RepID=A0ABD6F386_9BILA
MHDYIVTQMPSRCHLCGHHHVVNASSRTASPCPSRPASPHPSCPNSPCVTRPSSPCPQCASCPNRARSPSPHHHQPSTEQCKQCAANAQKSTHNPISYVLHDVFPHGGHGHHHSHHHHPH